ncbi:MAG TPA: response regulator transcription factor [Terracidiphilus sp.]|jgi:DNA-binding NarL/FixJ family response regulator
MKRTILICGLVGGLLIALLRWSEYQFLVIDHSVEIYAALVAAVFAGLGIWLGIRLTRSSRVAAVPDQPAAAPLATPVPAPDPMAFVPDQNKRDDLGITRREMEILELVAEGLSNREIAERLFVSENTVKTHCSRAFDKLGARRRTEAVLMGKKLGLLR